MWCSTYSKNFLSIFIFFIFYFAQYTQMENQNLSGTEITKLARKYNGRVNRLSVCLMANIFGECLDAEKFIDLCEEKINELDKEGEMEYEAMRLENKNIKTSFKKAYDQFRKKYFDEDDE
eukprot:TRINITY_DN481773_c0_g4_i1.p1 TRINITY_DN481773_c0_g4~~TRINITY_DN481773_c0_g4_i1.p1  ORF type:complete len:120 (-),score=7.90 TRINITY_DN481773_c0_g4_i1:147-506(-)